MKVKVPKIITVLSVCLLCVLFSFVLFACKDKNDTENGVEEITHVVSFDTDGGNAVASQTVKDGENAVKPIDPEKIGYSFLGWYKEDSESEFIFTAEQITADTTVYAKWEKITYFATFSCDENVEVYVYKTQDYTVEPTLTKLAFSRNSETGDFDISGDGQINLLLVFSEEYVLDGFNITGGYKNLKTVSEPNLINVYRITKITSDLEIEITSKKVGGTKMLTNISSYTSTDGKTSFLWNTLTDVEFVNVTVDCNGDTTELTVRNNSFEYNLESNKGYTFTFIPYYNENVTGETVEIHRAFMPDAKTVAFTRIEIETSNYILPSCDYVSAPDGCWGQGITNNDYVQSNIKMYNSSNEKIFDSGDILKTPTDEYSGAKIKIRGNTSAYALKKPYKIKLNKAKDLLKGLFTRTINPDYKSKEFVLLADYRVENYLIGREVSNIISDEYDFAYAYVSLFINGDYQGVYILSDAVNDKSCNVETDGYVIENDAYWWNEELYFNTNFTEGINNVAITFKYPDADDITETSPEYIYIQSYLNDFENALFNGEGDISDYIDVNSFAYWLLIHDILGNWDSGGANMYMVKKNSTDALLCAGPTWDFDGIFYQVDNYARIHIEGSSEHFYTWYLLENEDFYNAYLTKFNEFKDDLTTILTSEISGVMTAEFNAVLSCEALAYNRTYRSIEERVDNAMTFLNTHIAWMSDDIDSAEL